MNVEDKISILTKFLTLFQSKEDALCHVKYCTHINYKTILDIFNKPQKMPTVYYIIIEVLIRNNKLKLKNRYLAHCLKSLREEAKLHGIEFDNISLEEFKEDVKRGFVDD